MLPELPSSAMLDFVHLHVHSHYSLLDGASSISRLVDTACADDMRGLALTDHGNMFGIKEFFDYCQQVSRKRTAQGLPAFRGILGCEVYVAPHGKASKVHSNGDLGGRHLVLLAKNKQGYRNLIKIVSRAWTDGFYGRPRTDHADLERYHEGLIVSSACIAGEVPQAILEGDSAAARSIARWYHDLFGDDYYLELQRHEVQDPTVRAARDTYPKQQTVNAALLTLAQEEGIKVICTNDVHFAASSDADAHDHLLCISTGKDLDDPRRLLYTRQEWLKSRAEMNAIFGDVPAALTTTLEILDKVEDYDINSAPIMPVFPIPATFGSEEQWREKYSQDDLYREFTCDENGANPLPDDEGQQRIARLGGSDALYRIKLESDYLAALAYDGAKKLYGDPLSEEVTSRLRYELHVMKTMGFPGYFLIVQDFINVARQHLDVWVGPGRGSAAGSVVAYCLGITRLDPFRYGLLFERFLNPQRVSLPDIDTDFDDEGRGRVLQWVTEKYGAANCAHIITYATLATKNSLRDVARVEHVPLDVVNAWCKALPPRLADNLPMTVANAIKSVPELREAAAKGDEQQRRTLAIATELEGTVRGIGIHACGVIICRDAITAHVPVAVATDPATGRAITITQYDGHVVESTGLIKMDFLGLKTLSEEKETVRNIRRTRGITLDLATIPLDDAATFALFQQGATVGTFQFESKGMREYLRALQPTVFEDLIAMSALYRPGPMDNIPQFIARKNGKEAITYDLPCMEEYLRETYGITVYQEQVMLLSRRIAGFSLAESDTLRRAMGKKKKAIVDSMRPRFLAGGAAQGYDTHILEKIWSDWEKFASYAFNKSHAASYALVAYQTAYLKAHYPAEYFAAIMTVRSSDISEVARLSDECRSCGVPLRGPDINESIATFGVTVHGEIRFGIAAIKGVGTATAEALISEREKNGPYTTAAEIVQRVPATALNRKALEALVLAGALDSLGVQREQYFAARPGKDGNYLDTLVRFGQTYQQSAADAANSLFGESLSEQIAIPQPPTVDMPWSNDERLEKEREVVGMCLSAHPLDEYYAVVTQCNTLCTGLDDDTLRRRLQTTGSETLTLTVAAVVIASQTKTTQRNTPYGSSTLEDYAGQGTITIFDNWQRYQHYFTPGATLFLTLTYAPRFAHGSNYSLTIASVERLADKQRRLDQLTIGIDTTRFTTDEAQQLLTLLRRTATPQQHTLTLALTLHLPTATPTEKGHSITLSSKQKIIADKALLTFLANTPSLTPSLP